MAANPNLTKGYIIAFVATAIWSTTAIFIRYLNVNYQLPPLVLAFWRDLFAGIALALVSLVFRPRSLAPGKKHTLFFLVYGVILTLFNATWTISVFFNGAAVSTVLAYCSGAFTALLGWRLFGETLNRYKMIAVVLSLMGCVFVSGAYNPMSWNLNFLGIVTGIFSGLMMAGYSLMGREASKQAIHPLASLTYSFLIAAVFLLILNLLPFPKDYIAGEFMHSGDSWIPWLILLFLALGPTIGGYGLYTTSLQYLPASVANLIATLEPAFTAFLAYFFLNEILTFPQVAGSTLILLGVLLLRRSEMNGLTPNIRNLHPFDPDVK
jgi:drug/metabolite transporter (DMT)-like permease